MEDKGHKLLREENKESVLFKSKVTPYWRTGKAKFTKNNTEAARLYTPDGFCSTFSGEGIRIKLIPDVLLVLTKYTQRI